jgi:hypothetical protein
VGVVHPDALLDDWARIQVAHADGLGHTSRSILASAAGGASGPAGSRLPPGVLVPGLRGYIAVERVLAGLRPHYRQTALVHYVLPTIEVGRTAKQRASYMGIPVGTYTDRLYRLRGLLREAGAA